MTLQSLLALNCYQRACSYSQTIAYYYRASSQAWLCRACLLRVVITEPVHDYKVCNTTKIAHKCDIAKLAYLELLSQSLFILLLLHVSSITIACYYKACLQAWHHKACLLRAVITELVHILLLLLLLTSVTLQSLLASSCYHRVCSCYYYCTLLQSLHTSMTLHSLLAQSC